MKEDSNKDVLLLPSSDDKEIKQFPHKIILTACFREEEPKKK